MELNDKIVIYRTADGQTSIDVKLEDETVWLSANQMANLFDRDEKTIRKHINNVFSEGELEKENNTHFLRVALSFQFSIGKNLVDMLSNGFFIPAIKKCHMI